VPGERLTARKAVSANEPWTRPAPGDPPETLLPAFLLIESWCQAAAILAGGGTPNPDVGSGSAVLLAVMKGIQLPGAARPGDVVTHDVRLVRVVGQAAILAGAAHVDGRTVLTVAQVVTALRPATHLEGDRDG
jgi:3-hydroxyacyl-[acyl-carrier-protein] dehydratase